MLSVGESADRYYSAGLQQHRAENFDVARDYFAQAVRLNPSHAHAHSRLGSALLASGQVEAATQHLARAIELAPDDEEIAIAYAALLDANRQSAAAEQIASRLLSLGNESTQLAILHATICRRNGSEAEALAFIDRVLGNQNPRLRREEAALHFSAANLLDNLGRYDEAFDRAATASQFRDVQYNAGQVERPVREWLQYFTRPTLRRLPHATHGSELPVFIVGMPRSGTTLVEQILSSHPAVHGAGELRWLFQLCESLARRCPSGTPALSGSFDRLSITDVDELAEEYLGPLQALNPQATRIIDKMPTNFMHLGMIQILLPLSKVIYCRRDPLDTCLSCYMTDFAGGHDFSFALPSVGHYYLQHQAMMSHWKSVLNLSILEVNYERVVDDLEGQTRRMLEFLDLPWDDKCLRFYENERFVATASNAQVRQPIYRKSVGRWRNYEKHLGPLQKILK